MATSSNRKKTTLNEWIINALHSQAFDVLALPIWLKGLSRCTAKALIAGGFRNFRSIEEAFQSEFDFTTLPDFNSECLVELVQWTSEQSQEKAQKLKSGMDELKKLFD
ncbi:hypothetical protein [Psychromonas antarctica]|uniref:hypothetical protein n=1 Tax=Psychromonas antarctica TaxID=67573 RepID=UPI001EE79B2C|nr:hypothetical protein [Psychromonas antarctica]MCG6202750.1 hypothetical protein [Psychromonas antarctica]